jgi:D-glycero-D-manno-heptose 1,7-bisphosphate phosphatase
VTAAVFLDRDGVLIEDVDLLVDAADIRVLPGVAGALSRLKQHGLLLIVASNQTVVARGLASEAEVEQLQRCVAARLCEAGAPELDGFYYCPHHPQATLARYRCQCRCRKPGSGLLRQAAAEHGIALEASFMVGDRITDIIAGARAGCRTVQVLSGCHAEPPIVTAEALDEQIAADYTCADLAAAATWIMAGS